MEITYGNWLSSSTILYRTIPLALTMLIVNQYCYTHHFMQCYDIVPSYTITYVIP